MFSFLGMAPVDNPRLIVYVAVEKPNLEGNEKGSTPVAQIFKNVMLYGLSKLEVEKNNQKDRH